MKELNEMELREVEGGLVWAIIAGAMIVASFSEILKDWKNFERGLSGQPCK